jgi:outer membrane protein assembly factor BamA
MWLGLAALLSSCNVTKHLDRTKQERLLVKNGVAITDKSKKSFSLFGILHKKYHGPKNGDQLNLSERTALEYEMGPYFKQAPNQTIFHPLDYIFILKYYPKVGLYYNNINPKGWWHRFIKKSIAEPPAIFSPELTVRTARNFENQMRQRGYLFAKCTYEVKYPRFIWGYFDPKRDTSTYWKYVSVQYNLHLGRLQVIDDVRFVSRDSLVGQILQMTAGESKLKRGNPVDSRAFDAEKLRITSELKNRGYAFFAPNFIQYTGDTLGNHTNVTVEVLPVNDTIMHKTYIIGDIQVFSSIIPDVSSIRLDTTINGVYFATSRTDFYIRPERLYQAIDLRPSWPYRQVDFDKTFSKLSALGVFRFVTVKPQVDSVNTEKINVAISFTPNKKLAVGSDFDMHSINSSNTFSNNLLGSSLLGYFKNRNLFRGAEQFQTNIQGGIEFDVATHRHLIFSSELKFQNELILPRFYDYFGFWRTLNSIKIKKKPLVSNSLYDRLRQDGQARITVNYNYLDVTAFYRYNLFNASFGYQLRTNPEHQYTFDHIGVDVLRPKLDTKFDTNASEFLKRSFGNQLFTGFVLRSFSYTYQSKPNFFGEHWLFRLNTELSGAEELAVNQLYNLIAKKQDNWTISDLQFSKFARMDMDLVYTREFRKDLVGAVRVGTGIVSIFGDTRETPYVKQFYIGGPSSLRGWRIRELGPGSYHNTTPLKNQPYYEAGDFRFEFNGELRFPFFWWFKGAIFVDGGNIWTLKPDALRPGSEINLQSYRNVALNTGLGLRADFSYFVLRFDVGLKLRRPYEQGGSYWVQAPFQFKGENLNLNLAVGYPF